MKKITFSETQIATPLRQVEDGVPIPEVTRAFDGTREDGTPETTQIASEWKSALSQDLKGEGLFLALYAHLLSRGVCMYLVTIVNSRPASTCEEHRLRQ
ncbi:MAG: hypothetical protein MRJ68_16500 [Nitrospira sp.]|nr:hypothetical protein [Nitrospira sp.]